jgi:asparagine synthase (glutamine-hydrolysing)
MCGIAGAISSSGIDPAVLPAMGDAIRHRGPDGEGYLLHSAQEGPRIARSVENGNRRAPVTVGFAHRRLTIIDLTEASDQPMVSADGDYVLAYNGELYNYVELREELEALGRPARTSGDTEIVLNAYAEWGPACLERMVGMWAFAILDVRRREVLLAVDRFGIKPLFYTVANETLYFGSEIKALLEAPGVMPEPDESVCRRFLLTGRVDDSEQTFFDGIRRLQPATHATIPIDRPVSEPRPERYWSFPTDRFRGSRAAAAREFKERLAESVRVHLRSDVPVGTCLSGGLDSSAIVCLADELRRKGAVPKYAHSGFGYIPEDGELSERRFMDEVVSRTGIEMTYVEPSPERFQSALLEIVRQQDEPFGSTSIAAQWFVFEAAHRAKLKVMLDGQGSDEILAGYHGYYQPVGIAHLRARRPFKYLRFNRQYRRLVGEPVVPPRLALHYLDPRRRAHDDQAAPEISVELPPMQLMSNELRAQCEYDDVATPEFKSINELLAAQTGRLGLPSLLRFEDRNSMAHSIEARVPFLDHRLVEFLFSLPGEYKLRGLETKHVMREALRHTLPEPIRTRTDKIGFRAEPTATWELAERNRDALLESRTSYEDRWFRREGLSALLSSGDRAEQTEFLLWRAVNLKLWLRTFWAEPAAVLSA